MSRYLSQLSAILWKDLLVELRTRERVAAMAAFAVLAAVLFDFGIDRSLVRPQDIAAGLLWMTIVFSGILGVGRTFDLEARDAAMQGILLTPVPRDVVYFGKALANFILLFATALLVLFVFWLFFDLPLGAVFWAVALVLAVGTLGFVALTTLFAGISSGTRMGDTLLPILVFPLLAPLVVYGTGATGRLLAGRPFVEVAGSLRMLAAFALVALAAGSILFRFVVEE